MFKKDNGAIPPIPRGGGYPGSNSMNNLKRKMEDNREYNNKLLEDINQEGSKLELLGIFGNVPIFGVRSLQIEDEQWDKWLKLIESKLG